MRSPSASSRAVRETGTVVDAELEQLIGVAALLHDVTHVPFGHTLEDERCLFPRHDKGARLAKLLNGALGERLARLGLRDAVAAMLGVATVAVPLWARQIVSSTIDADLLDYLRRDSYFAGLAQNYDDRIFRYFIVDNGQLAINMTKHGMERPDARSETVQLLRMRYFLTERVYYHHTKVAAGAMISKAVELAHDAWCGRRRRAAAADRREALRTPAPNTHAGRAGPAHRPSRRAPRSTRAAQAWLRRVGADGPRSRAPPARRTLSRVAVQPP